MDWILMKWKKNIFFFNLDLFSTYCSVQYNKKKQQTTNHLFFAGEPKIGVYMLNSGAKKLFVKVSCFPFLF